MTEISIALVTLAVVCLAAAQIAHWREHGREQRRRMSTMTEMLGWMRAQEQYNRSLYELDRAMWAMHGIGLPSGTTTPVPSAFEKAFRE